MSEFIKELNSIFNEDEGEWIDSIIKKEIISQAERFAMNIKDDIKHQVQKGKFVKVGNTIKVNNSIASIYQRVRFPSVDPDDSIMYRLLGLSENQKKSYGIVVVPGDYSYYFELYFFRFYPEEKNYHNMWQTQYYTDYIFNNNSYNYNKRYKDFYIKTIQSILSKDSIDLRIYIYISKNDKNIISYDITFANPKVDYKFLKTQEKIDCGFMYEATVTL